MTTKVTLPAHVWCSEEGCNSYFEIELPLNPVALFTVGNPELSGRVNIVPPDGWYIEAHWVALCEDHNPLLQAGPQMPTEIEESAKGTEEPPADVLELASKLQALAMDRSTTEHERAAAWERFGELWKRYNLPDELGLEILR